MTIAETAKMYDLTADTLRYYERIGLIPSVNRTQGGIRDYTEQDCRWVSFAKCMRGAGISVETLIEYVALFQQGDATKDQRKQLLIEQRDQLAARVDELRQTLDRLNAKIERYDQTIGKAEAGLS